MKFMKNIAFLYIVYIMKNINIDIKYIFIIFLAIIFFIYGLILSEIIDYIFPEHDKSLPDYRVAIEILGELGIVYIIYFTFNRYIGKFINMMFKNLLIQEPYYLNQLLLIAFSTGIYRHLQKSTDKTRYFKQKFITTEMIDKYSFYPLKNILYYLVEYKSS
jgi:hypothetical protein